jgi:uncharacterized protein YwgA/DNA-binding transcriptional ArsR family regulator
MHLLERGKATEILLALREKPMHFTELQWKVGGSLSTVQLRVEELLREGLIAEEEQKKWPFKRILKLTDKGMNAARYLQGLRAVTSTGLPKKREKWMLALMHAFGEIKGSTRLQKLLFLLSRELKLSDYSYTWHIYGPYSPEVGEDSRELESSGLIQVSEEIFEESEEDYRRRLNYKLTPFGEVLAAKVFDGLSEKQKNAIRSLQKFNKASLSSLLDYVHSEYSPRDLMREEQTQK